MISTINSNIFPFDLSQVLMDRLVPEEFQEQLPLVSLSRIAKFMFCGLLTTTNSPYFNYLLLLV